MSSPRPLVDLFREEAVGLYDWTREPDFVPLVSDAVATPDAERHETWEAIQQDFIARTEDPQKYAETEVQRVLDERNRYFEGHGPLRGDVLDIGGGWGLYREWWDAAPGSRYVVHDPGVERFLRRPHDTLLRLYESAFSRPMSYVEGFGEDLPYRDDSFSTCLIASTLDHCADAEAVLREVRRCLRPGGQLLVFQHLEEDEEEPEIPSLLTRITRLLGNPKRLKRRIKMRLRRKDEEVPHHLHHFTAPSLRALIEAVGFVDLQVSDGRVHGRVRAFEARNPG